MPHKTKNAKLTVSVDLHNLPLFQDLIATVSASSYLSEEQVNDVDRVASEVFTNAASRASLPGHPGFLSLTAEWNQTKLVISLRNQYLPGDLSLKPDRDMSDAQVSDREELSGMGLILNGSVMDEAEWICRGTGEKELILTYFLKPVPHDHLDKTRERSVRKSTPDPAPPQAYTFRRFMPEDADEVIQCIIGIYGYSYPRSDIYNPNRIIELNNHGQMYSAVAVSQLNGEVVAFTALERYGSGPFAEMGLTVVAPAHRKRGLATELASFLEKEAARAGISILVVHEVTSHPTTRSSRSGFNPCAITLGSMPIKPDFNRLSGESPQRESCLVSFKYLVPAEQTIVCAPYHHQSMLERIYASHGRSVDFQNLPIPLGFGEITVIFKRNWGIADIHLHHTGSNTATDIHNGLCSLREIPDIKVIYVELPLDQGGIDGICRMAEGDGFFFAGIGPGSVPVRESLYLQYLTTPIDYSQIRIASSMGNEILEYAISEQERVG